MNECGVESVVDHDEVLNSRERNIWPLDAESLDRRIGILFLINLALFLPISKLNHLLLIADLVHVKLFIFHINKFEFLGLNLLHLRVYLVLRCHI